MYGNKSKNLEQYQKSEGAFNTIKTGNQVIAGILKELHRSMVIVANNIENASKSCIRQRNVHANCATTTTAGVWPVRKLVKDYM